MTDHKYLRRLGLRIKQARISKGMTQEELAVRCHLAKANLSRIESGKTNLTVLTLKRLCAELTTKISDLFIAS
jgi:transcriptional regulator with XRE-family HTH domain